MMTNIPIWNALKFLHWIIVIIGWVANSPHAVSRGRGILDWWGYLVLIIYTLEGNHARCFDCISNGHISIHPLQKVPKKMVRSNFGIFSFYSTQFWKYSLKTFWMYTKLECTKVIICVGGSPNVHLAAQQGLGLMWTFEQNWNILS